MKKFYLLAFIASLFAFNQALAVTGDVNGDSEVNIADVNAIIDIILGGNPVATADVNGDSEVNIADINTIIDIILGGGPQDTLTPKDIALDFSPLDEGTEVFTDDEDDEDYGDYVENTMWTTKVYINFDGETATVTGNPTTVIATVDGAHVTITSVAKRVQFIATGSTENGSIKFYSERKFQLRLDGASITNPHGAAINNQCGKSFYLVAGEGTVNTLCDGEDYAMVDGEDQKGTVFSEGQILVSGKGTLNIYSVGKNCMASDDYIFIRPATRLYLNSTGGNGIKAKDFVYVKGGVINMEISADGAKGINCDSLVTIAGGRITIINSGATRFETDEAGNEDYTTCAGVKADNRLVMTGGTLNIKCTGDDAKGINVTEPFLFSGGELNVVCTGKLQTVDPKGVKCDTNCDISGGAFYSCAVNGRAMDIDGILTINPGYATLTDQDPRLFEVIY